MEMYILLKFDFCVFVHVCAFNLNVKAVKQKTEAVRLSAAGRERERARDCRRACLP